MGQGCPSFSRMQEHWVAQPGHPARGGLGAGEGGRVLRSLRFKTNTDPQSRFGSGTGPCSISGWCGAALGTHKVSVHLPRRGLQGTSGILGSWMHPTPLPAAPPGQNRALRATAGIALRDEHNFHACWSNRPRLQSGNRPRWGCLAGLVP